MSGFPPGGLLTDDSFASPPGANQWGIFGQDGSPLLAVDSVFALEYARDYRISDYPQEQGAFATYNKIQIPFAAKLTFQVARSRVPFLTSVENAVNSLDLVTVVTPEVSYANANLIHYGYRRQKENAELILIDVWCEEVRVLPAGTLSNTQTINGQPPAQNGLNQTQPPPPAVGNNPPGLQ